MEGDLQRRVGENLRVYRLSRSLSQEAFADVLGLHRTYVGGLERGERNLTLKAVERIAEAIKVQPEELLIASPIGIDPVEPKFNLPANRSVIAHIRKGRRK